MGAPQQRPLCSRCSSLPFLALTYLLVLLSAPGIQSRLGDAEDEEEGLKVDLVKIRKFAAALDPELIEHAAPDARYSRKYRNPCWEDGSGGLRCIPGAYILGGFHSGVTSMAIKVSRHPSIVTDAMSHAQFWGEEGKKMRDFVDGFQAASASIRSSPSQLLLEASQSTLTFYIASGAKAHRHFAAAMAPCYRNCSEASTRPEGESQEQCMAARCYGAAQEADRQLASSHGFDYLLDQNIPLLMRAVYGDKLPKLIAVIRDPVDRLHSAYYGYPHYYGKHGRNPSGFLAYLKEQTAAFSACEAAAALRSDPQLKGAVPGDTCALLFELLGMTEEKVFFHCDQLMRGMYVVFLERWLRVFPRSQLLVIKAEDYFKNQMGTLEKIFKFLDLPSPGGAVWDSIKYAGPRNSYGREHEMLPEARQLLQRLYQPYNARLAVLLKDPSLVQWNQNVTL